LYSKGILTDLSLLGYWLTKKNKCENASIEDNKGCDITIRITTEEVDH